MTANAIAIARSLTSAGVEPKAANAMAEAIVTHADESLATKADLANVRTEIANLRSELKQDIARIETKLNIFIALNLAILVAFLADKLVK